MTSSVEALFLSLFILHSVLQEIVSPCINNSYTQLSACTAICPNTHTKMMTMTMETVMMIRTPTTPTETPIEVTSLVLEGDPLSTVCKIGNLAITR